MKIDKFDFHSLSEILKDEDEPEFEDIWMHNIPNYLLVLSAGKKPENYRAYSIYEIDSRCVILLEDEVESESIVREMLRSNVRVVNKIPEEYLT